MNYRIPVAFYDDHVARDLPGGVLLRRTKSYLIVDLAAAEYAELRSDAAYYAAEAKYMGPEMFGLGRSAAATVRALDEQGPPPPPEPLEPLPTGNELTALCRGLEAEAIDLWRNRDGRISVSYRDTEARSYSEPVEPFGLVRRPDGGLALVDLDGPAYSTADWWREFRLGLLTRIGFAADKGRIDLCHDCGATAPDMHGC